MIWPKLPLMSPSNTHLGDFAFFWSGKHCAIASCLLYCLSRLADCCLHADWLCNHPRPGSLYFIDTPRMQIRSISSFHPIEKSGFVRYNEKTVLVCPPPRLQHPSVQNGAAHITKNKNTLGNKGDLEIYEIKSCSAVSFSIILYTSIYLDILRFLRNFQTFL